MQRTRSRKRASIEEIEAMPALLTTEDVARITGWSLIFTAKACREGCLKDCAVKAGKYWSINKAKALEVLGLA